LTIEESRIDRFRADLCEYVVAEAKEEDLTAEIRIDAESPLAQLTLKTVQQIEQLSPFGQGNPRPILCTGDVTLADVPRRIGAGERHLSVKVKQHNLAFRAVAFGHGDWAEPLAEIDGPIHIAYRPVINHFRGRNSVELQLVDYRIGDGSPRPD